MSHDNHGLSFPSHDGVVYTKVKKIYIVDSKQLRPDIYYNHEIIPLAVLKVVTDAHTSHSFELTNYYSLETVEKAGIKKGDRVRGYLDKSKAQEHVKSDKIDNAKLLQDLERIMNESR